MSSEQEIQFVASALRDLIQGQLGEGWNYAVIVRHGDNVAWGTNMDARGVADTCFFVGDASASGNHRAFDPPKGGEA